MSGEQDEDLIGDQLTHLILMKEAEIERLGEKTPLRTIKEISKLYCVSMNSHRSKQLSIITRFRMKFTLT